ncbi:MAG: DUF2169 family type VI secretion system accessory protein [Polyangiaceae bacterium]
MPKPRVDNRTDFVVFPQVLVDRDGEKLVAMVKATFESESPGGGTLELAPRKRRRGIRTRDFPWGEPEKTTIAYPADICVRKPGTDVVFVAKAHAPDGVPVPMFDAYAQVGSLRKAIQVHGLRVWQADGSGLSAARPLAELEIRYEHAWGGFDDKDPKKVVEEARNPMGKGCVGNPASLTDKEAPQIEDPGAPIKSWRTRPPPAGMGPIGRHWEPRRGHVGTYDAAWKELKAPLLPDDFDDRYNQCASPGLIADPPLKTGEEVKLLNLVPGGGPTLFSLPRVALEIEFRPRGGEPRTIRPHLDTVLVDLMGFVPGQAIAVEMVWRASIPAPRFVDQAQVVVREVKA